MHSYQWLTSRVTFPLNCWSSCRALSECADQVRGRVPDKYTMFSSAQVQERLGSAGKLTICRWYLISFIVHSPFFPPLLSTSEESECKLGEQGSVPCPSQFSLWPEGRLGAFLSVQMIPSSALIVPDAHSLGTYSPGRISINPNTPIQCLQ